MDELNTKNRMELLAMADKLKINVHHKCTDDTIRAKIRQQPQAHIKDAMQHPAAAIVAPVITNTPDDVKAAIAPYMAKEGFIAEFPDDGTWIFSYKGTSESGNLAIPLRIIKQKAESIARGKRGPALVKSPYDGSLIMSA